MHLLPIYLVLCGFFCSTFAQFQYQNRRSFRPGLFRACDLPKLKNGVVRLRQRGRLVNYSCRPPFVLYGDRYASCVSGRWDVRSPICIKNGCPAIQTPDNAVVYPTYDGAVLTMFCHSGYQRVGSAHTYCDGSDWDRPLGVCREISTAVEKTCDFETDDLCGWTQDANHDFDWKRTNGIFFGKVLSIGPKQDHTIQRQFEGYYMYLDMKDEDIGAKARLVSPSFPANQSMNACFRLYYHMFGLSPGKLRVYAKPLSTEILDAVGNDGYKFFETVGNQGNLWKEGFFQLPVFKEEFQIVIEGTSTRSYDSHIAIDDLALLNGTDCDVGGATATDDNKSEDGDAVFGTLSCENRCGEEETTLAGDATDFIKSVNGTVIKKCDCFYGCEDINTCCTNYRAVCAQATTPEEEVATEPTTLKTTTTTTKKPTTLQTKPTSTTPRTTTIKKTTTVKVTTTPKTTTTSTTSTTTSTSTTTTSTTTTMKPDDIVPLDVTPYDEDYSEEDIEHLSARHHQEAVFPIKSNNSNFIATTILTGLVIFGVLIAIGSGVVYYRRKKFDPRNYKQNNGRNGVEHAEDEFSEVRYLTTDEQLDFTIQTPSNN